MSVAVKVKHKLGISSYHLNFNLKPPLLNVVLVKVAILRNTDHYFSATTLPYFSFLDPTLDDNEVNRWCDSGPRAERESVPSRHFSQPPSTSFGTPSISVIATINEGHSVDLLVETIGER